MANNMEKEKQRLLQRKEKLLWGERPGRDGTPYSYKKTETLLDVIDARIEQHNETVKQILEDIEDIVKKNLWNTDKDGKAIAIQIEEYKKDALVSGDEHGK